MIDINILQKQNSLIINENGLICVKPVNQYNYTTFPLETLDDCLALTTDDYVLLKAGYYRFTEDLTRLEINEDK